MKTMLSAFVIIPSLMETTLMCALAKKSFTVHPKIIILRNNGVILHDKDLDITKKSEVSIDGCR